MTGVQAMKLQGVPCRLPNIKFFGAILK